MQCSNKSKLLFLWFPLSCIHVRVFQKSCKALITSLFDCCHAPDVFKHPKQIKVEWKTIFFKLIDKWGSSSKPVVDGWHNRDLSNWPFFRWTTGSRLSAILWRVCLLDKWYCGWQERTSFCWYSRHECDVSSIVLPKRIEFFVYSACPEFATLHFYVNNLHCSYLQGELLLYHKVCVFLNHRCNMNTSTIASNVTRREQCGHASNSLILNVIVTIFLFVLLLGILLGNTLVIMAIAMVRRLWTPPNILLVSLAASDWLIGAIVVPLSLLTEQRYIFGHACDIILLLENLLSSSSIINLTAIAVDRYLLLTR